MRTLKQKNIASNVGELIEILKKHPENTALECNLEEEVDVSLWVPLPDCTLEPKVTLSGNCSD